jgi:hypothetical protein
MMQIAQSRRSPTVPTRWVLLIVRLCLFAGLGLLSGCIGTGDLPAPGSQERVLQQWPKPRDTDTRDDSDVPWGQVWPATMALIAPSSSIVGNIVLPDATLILATHPRLADDRELEVGDVRFALPVRNAKLRGEWIRLSGDARYVFLMEYHSGGTAGYQVYVFLHRTSFARPGGGYQFHQVVTAWSGVSSGGSYLLQRGDQRSYEFVVRPGQHLNNYEVIRWENGSVRAVETVSEEDLRRWSMRGQVRRLSPG